MKQERKNKKIMTMKERKFSFVQVGVKFGVQVEVSSPGKALLGGASANYGFETHFSYKHGWDSGESTTRTVTNTANEICLAFQGHQQIDNTLGIIHK